MRFTIRPTRRENPLFLMKGGFVYADNILGELKQAEDASK